MTASLQDRAAFAAMRPAVADGAIPARKAGVVGGGGKVACTSGLHTHPVTRAEKDARIAAAEKVEHGEVSA